MFSVTWLGPHSEANIMEMWVQILTQKSYLDFSTHDVYMKFLQINPQAQNLNTNIYWIKEKWGEHTKIHVSQGVIWKIQVL